MGWTLCDRQEVTNGAYELKGHGWRINERKDQWGKIKAISFTHKELRNDNGFLWYKRMKLLLVHICEIFLGIDYSRQE